MRMNEIHKAEFDEAILAGLKFLEGLENEFTPEQRLMFAIKYATGYMSSKPKLNWGDTQAKMYNEPIPDIFKPDPNWTTEMYKYTNQHYTNGTKI